MLYQLSYRRVDSHSHKLHLTSRHVYIAPNLAAPINEVESHDLFLTHTAPRRSRVRVYEKRPSQQHAEMGKYDRQSGHVYIQRSRRTSVFIGSFEDRLRNLNVTASA